MKIDIAEGAEESKSISQRKHSEIIKLKRKGDSGVIKDRRLSTKSSTSNLSNTGKLKEMVKHRKIIYKKKVQIKREGSLSSQDDALNSPNQRL